jgi:hypothetical protein
MTTKKKTGQKKIQATTERRRKTVGRVGKKTVAVGKKAGKSSKKRRAK